MRKRITSIGAVVGAATLTGMVMAPAFAAATVAQADATAINLSIAGNGAYDSGQVVATHDGEKLTKSGNTSPELGALLTGQELLQIGTLAQNATAAVDGLDGVSAACAGVAGNDATLVEVGGSTCLNDAEGIGVTIGNLDLAGTELIGAEGALAPLGEGLAPLSDLLFDQLLNEVGTALQDGLAPLGDAGLTGSLGVVQAFCVASPGQASGRANIADAGIKLAVADQEFTIVDLPVNPPPNTKLVTDLDEVILAITAGVKTQLTNGLDGALVQAIELINVTEEEIVNTVVAQLADALAPIEENLLDGTLNKQTSTAQGHIEVTALDLKVLPAAGPLLDTQIATVSCGPNGRVAPPEPPTELPEVPTVIDSGTPRDGGMETGDVLVGGAVVLAALGGLIGYRRFATNV